MSGPQLNNLLLLDLVTGLSRTPETGATPDILQLENDVELLSGANLRVSGNLAVSGTFETVNQEQVNVGDNNLFLNAGYTTVAPLAGGITVNYLPTATSDAVGVGGFTAGVAAVSNPTVITVGAGTFAAGDIIQISGAEDESNNGIYEVNSHVGTTLSVRGIGTVFTTQPWLNNDFTTDTTASGTITVVNVAVLQANNSGDFQVGKGSSTTGFTYDPVIPAAVDLQTAYENGNIITTSGADGPVTINGDQSLQLNGTVALDVNTTADFDVTQFDVDVTGAGFSLDATGGSNVTVSGSDLDIQTLGGGSVSVDGEDGVNINSTSGPIGIGDVADTGAINIGTGAAARTITVGNSTGATALDFVSGTGSFSFQSTVDEESAIFSVSTTGSGGDAYEVFVGGLDPSAGAGVPAPVGSLYHRDVGNAGTSGEVYLKTGAADTAWEVVGTGVITLQEAYEAGNTIVTDNTNGPFDVSGSESISLDSDSASNFTVDGNDLTLSTTTSGNLLLSGADSFDLSAGGPSQITAAGDISIINSGTGFLEVSSFDGIDVDASNGPINIGGAADAQAINIGTGLSVRTITVGNSTGATGVILNVGTGELAVNSTVGEEDPVVTWSTTGIGGDSVEMFVGTSNPDAGITGLAGSLFMRDTGTGGELYINTSTGSGTDWDRVITTEDLDAFDLQEAYENGNTIVTDNANGPFDVSGTETISLDAGAASNFTVDGASLTLSTTTSGTLDITSAEDIQMSFETNNATAMVIDDGTNNFMTFDSTTGSLGVRVNQFLDITGSGAGITLDAGVAISAGNLVTIEDTTGDFILADSNTGTTIDGLCIGVAAESATAGNPVKVYTVPGSLVPVTFGAAPAANRNGDPVYVSQTGGQATLTPPTGSGNVVFVIGILQGANGVSTTPNVVYQPQFIAVRP